MWQSSFSLQAMTLLAKPRSGGQGGMKVVLWCHHWYPSSGQAAGDASRTVWLGPCPNWKPTALECLPLLTFILITWSQLLTPGIALEHKSETCRNMSTKILLSRWHLRSATQCSLITNPISSYSVSAHVITWVPQNRAERLLQPCQALTQCILTRQG